MLDRMSQTWWSPALRGIVAIVLGIAAFTWPGLTVLLLVTLFGIYALVDGVLALVAAASPGGGRGWLLLEGVVGVIAGVLCFVHPLISAIAIVYVIAAWAIVTGIAEIAAAVELRREMTGEWLFVLTGIVSILFGIAIAAMPALGVLMWAYAIGAYAILFGILMLALAVRVHGVHHTPPSRLQTTS